MGSQKAPPPPDPKETASASTGTNIGTAIANANLSGVNQIGPNGTKMREQTGSYSYKDPFTGQSYDIPTFTETTTLSPQEQQLQDLNNKTQANLGQIGVDQSAKIGGLLGTNVDLSNEATEARLWELGSKRLEPRFEQDENALRARLANQGLQPGSQAYASEMRRLTEGKNDARNQLLLSGRGQAVQEALTQRNQPLNEIIGLMNGSQVTMPQFGAVNMPTIPTTDTAGLINQNYNQRLQATQMNNQQQQGLLGGLMGLGSAGLYKFSDRRLKVGVTLVGETFDGLPIYSYRYRSGGPTELGFMAQDIEKVRPEAVITTPSGFKAVDYDRALAKGA